MKVSIVTEGFNSTGYGHITRCSSLYDAFVEKSIEPTLYINGDENAVPFVKNYRHKIFNWLSHPAKLSSEIKYSDILIIDSYLAGKDFYENMPALCGISLFIDDNQRLDYPAGIVLNGTVGSENFDYPKSKKNSYLLGSSYIPLRREFWNVPAKKINQEFSTVLITFGGQDTRNLTHSVLENLQNNFPDITKKVVIGSGFTNTKVIEKLKDSKTELYYSPGASEIFGLMMECDICISAAGQTVYELASIGVPTVTIIVADNQKNNFAGWKKKGFLLDEIYYTDFNLLDKIVKQMNKLSGVTLRKKLSGIGRKHVDGKGALRAVEKLIGEIANQKGFFIRKAALKDADLVYALSNDPVVRQNSINRNPIPKEDHEKWYPKKIIQPDYLFLLAFDRNEKFIGQIRFEIEGNSATVSISVVENFRGKGLSKKILTEASAYAFRSFSKINKIYAYIRPENVSSVRAFEKAGYKFLEDESINGESFRKLYLNG